MIESKHFDSNDALGIKRTWHYNTETDEATVETSQDITAIIEENKQDFNLQEKHSKYGEWNKVASIPLSIYFKLKQEGKLDDQAYMKRFLNDPDNRYFRTRPGEV
jgi:hypothetical protein